MHHKMQTVAAKTKAKRIMKQPFQVGESVYARWFGDEILTIVERAKVESPLPHYICSSENGNWIIPRIHLSRKKITSETLDSNRRQLKLSIE